MSQFEVIVGNVGTVYRGDCKADAMREFRSYVAIAAKPGCRASGETVTMICDGEIEMQVSADTPMATDFDIN